MTKPKLVFRQLVDEDVEAFRDIRLEALQKYDLPPIIQSSF